MLRAMTSSRIWLSGITLLAALLACKGSKKAEPTATTSVASSPPTKLPFSPSVSQLRGVCEGKAVPGLDVVPREKAKAALFVRQPGAEFEHIDYDKLVAYKDKLAVTLSEATTVVCIDITKKKKNKSCIMTPLDPAKLGGTLNIYDYQYTVTLRETATGKVSNEAKKSRSDKQCPSVHVFEKSEEDMPLPYAVTADSAVSSYREGK
jgi:hypothetical protein